MASAQMVIMSIKGDWLITLQQTGDNFHSLPVALETSICVQQIKAELFVFTLVPARAQSQHQPSIGKIIHCSGHAGGVDRMPERERGHQGAKFDTLGMGGQPGQGCP